MIRKVTELKIQVTCYRLQGEGLWRFPCNLQPGTCNAFKKQTGSLYMKYVSIIFICLISSLLANAQQQLTLQDAIGAALKNNYDILLTRNDSTSYALDRYYSFAAFMPQLNGAANVL